MNYLQQNWKFLSAWVFYFAFWVFMIVVEIPKLYNQSGRGMDTLFWSILGLALLGVYLSALLFSVIFDEKNRKRDLIAIPFVFLPVLVIYIMSK